MVFFCILHFALSSCSIQKQLATRAKDDFFDDKNFSPAHIGIAIFNPATNKFLYNYQSEKYFVPASNTKLFSLYAGLKYLGDSIIAARYIIDGDRIILQATGDPTFLHPDFKNQPLLKFLQQRSIKKITIQTAFASQPLARFHQPTLVFAEGLSGRWLGVCLLFYSHPSHLTSRCLPFATFVRQRNYRCGAS